MLKINKANKLFGIVRELLNIYSIPILAVGVGCWQLFYFGYPYGHDWIFELVRIAEYSDSLSNTIGMPFWAGNLYYGYGSPIFVYYAPLYVGVASIGVLLGLSVTKAAIVVFVFFLLIAMVGIAGLTGELVGNKNRENLPAIRVASVAYVLAPYFLADMLIRNASAEFTALCIAPYPVWGLIRLYRGKTGGFSIVTLGMMFSILAHNLSALIEICVLLLLSILLFYPEKQYSKLIKSNIAIILGVGMAAWFWLPALWMKDLVRITDMVQGKFDFHKNFLMLENIFLPMDPE